MWRIIVPVSSRQSPHSSGGHDDHVERGAGAGDHGESIDRRAFPNITPRFGLLEALRCPLQCVQRVEPVAAPTREFWSPAHRVTNCRGNC
jgi:hypothetical protein